MEGLLFSSSHLLSLHLELVLFGFVHTAQAPQSSCLRQPLHVSHFFRRIRFFLSTLRRLGDDRGPGPSRGVNGVASSWLSKVNGELALGEATSGESIVFTGL